MSKRPYASFWLCSIWDQGHSPGPSLPVFLTPNVLETLVKTFDIKPITTPDADLKAILG